MIIIWWYEIGFPLIDGMNPAVGSFTRVESYFEVQNISDEVKVKLVKLWSYHRLACEDHLLVETEARC